MSERGDIRDAVVALLTTAGICGGNVKKGKHDAVSSVPACLVSTGEQSREPITIHPPRTFGVELDVEVALVDEGTSTAIVEEKLDVHSDAVVAAIAGSNDLSGLVKDAYVSSVSYDINADGSKSVGTSTATIKVIYNVSEY